jgi:hypothetical protein
MTCAAHTIAAASTTLVPVVCVTVVLVMNSFTLMLIIMQTALPLSKETRLCWLFTF